MIPAAAQVGMRSGVALRTRRASTLASFPSNPNASPFEILSLPRNASSNDVKKRYLEMCKAYHPDVVHAQQVASTSAQAQEIDDRFTKIQAAYDLLRDSNSRQTYLRFGAGWDTASRLYSEVPLDLRHNPWGTPKNRQAHQRAHYPSSEWDWHQDAYRQDDFYTANFRHDKPITPFMSNRTLLWSLGGCSFALYLFQMLAVIPASHPETQQRLLNGEETNMFAGASPTGPTERHIKTAKDLSEARMKAKQYAEGRREGIKRAARVQQLRRQQKEPQLSISDE